MWRFQASALGHKDLALGRKGCQVHGFSGHMVLGFRATISHPDYCQSSSSYVRGRRAITTITVGFFLPLAVIQYTLMGSLVFTVLAHDFRQKKASFFLSASHTTISFVGIIARDMFVACALHARLHLSSLLLLLGAGIMCSGRLAFWFLSVLGAKVSGRWEWYTFSN